jgi:hypothetical protein
VEKCCRAVEATNDNIIRRMRFACWITKTTDTHAEYVILIAFPRQQWLRECTSMLLLYVHCLSCSSLSLVDCDIANVLTLFCVIWTQSQITDNQVCQLYTVELNYKFPVITIFPNSDFLRPSRFLKFVITIPEISYSN